LLQCTPPRGLVQWWPAALPIDPLCSSAQDTCLKLGLGDEAVAQATVAFQVLGEAYHVLSDPEQRAIYDQQLVERRAEKKRAVQAELARRAEQAEMAKRAMQEAKMKAQAEEAARLQRQWAVWDPQRRQAEHAELMRRQYEWAPRMATKAVPRSERYNPREVIRARVELGRKEEEAQQWEAQQREVAEAARRRAEEARLEEEQRARQQAELNRKRELNIARREAEKAGLAGRLRGERQRRPTTSW
jgi:curved DNA-binding protein CbpA